MIQFTDVASTEVSFERRGEALVLKRGATGDQITLNNFYGYSYYGAPPQVEQFRFTDTTLNINSVMSRAITYGTTGADNLSAYYTPTGHTMFLGDGNDSIQGSQFADTINLEAGDDYVQGYAGNDTIDGGLGNDSLSGNDGTTRCAVAMALTPSVPGAGNDTVTGGTGNDTISDEGGTDTYLFAKGWGADVLTEAASARDLADVIQFTDVASTEVSFERRGDALVLKRGATGDQITLNNFYGYSYYAAPPQVEQFRFTDTTLNVNSVMSRAITYGTSGADNLSAYYTPTGHTMFLGDGNDSIQGSQFADTINLEAGDDYVQGYGGNDTIDGGLGNDTLYGNEATTRCAVTMAPTPSVPGPATTPSPAAPATTRSATKVAPTLICLPRAGVRMSLTEGGVGTRPRRCDPVHRRGLHRGFVRAPRRRPGAQARRHR